MNEPVTRSMEWEDRGHTYEVTVRFEWHRHGQGSHPEAVEMSRYEPTGLSIQATDDDPLFDSQTTRRLKWGYITTALWPTAEANAAAMREGK